MYNLLSHQLLKRAPNLGGDGLSAIVKSSRQCVPWEQPRATAQLLSQFNTAIADPESSASTGLMTGSDGIVYLSRPLAGLVGGGSIGGS